MNDNDDVIQQAMSDFISTQKTLILSTVNTDNQPLASYTPFVRDEKGSFYIFISEMAEHSKNICRANKKGQTISIMLIEDEQNSRNLFARKRLSYNCIVGDIHRDHEEWLLRIEQFQQKFGKIMELLSQLGDFHLYRLKPANGNFVLGFGKAYSIDKGTIQHISS